MDIIIMIDGARRRDIAQRHRSSSHQHVTSASRPKMIEALTDLLSLSLRSSLRTSKLKNLVPCRLNAKGMLAKSGAMLHGA